MRSLRVLKASWYPMMTNVELKIRIWSSNPGACSGKSGLDTGLFSCWGNWTMFEPSRVDSQKELRPCTIGWSKCASLVPRSDLSGPNRIPQYILLDLTFPIQQSTVNPPTQKWSTEVHTQTKSPGVRQAFLPSSGNIASLKRSNNRVLVVPPSSLNAFSPIALAQQWFHAAHVSDALDFLP